MDDFGRSRPENFCSKLRLENSNRVDEHGILSYATGLSGDKRRTFTPAPFWKLCAAIAYDFVGSQVRIGRSHEEARVFRPPELGWEGFYPYLSTRWLTEPNAWCNDKNSTVEGKWTCAKTFIKLWIPNQTFLRPRTRRLDTSVDAILRNQLA